MPFVPFTLLIRGQLHVIDSPRVMGIINCTPDSFFADSRSQQEETVLAKAAQMCAEGAWMLDLGGQSTRPGARTVSEAEEADRVIPHIESVCRAFPEMLVSIDTFYASVARAALAAGASVVNDVSGGLADPNMLQAVATAKAVYICMHSRGTAATMQQQNQYSHLMADLIDFFTERSVALLEAGIQDWLADPGFGFAKNAEQNFHLLHHLSDLRLIKRPLLAGLSRKKTVYQTLGIQPSEALNGTTVLHTLALQQGAAVLRVHDVREAMESIILTEKVRAHGVDKEWK